MDVCDFCGKRFKNLSKLLECSITNNKNAAVRFHELIQIFNNDVVQLIVKNSEKHICVCCCNKLGNCYEFVKNLQQQMTASSTEQITTSKNTASTNLPSLTMEPPVTKAYRQILPKENRHPPGEMKPLPFKIKKPSRRYQCCTCAVQFTSFHKLKQHSLQHNSCSNNNAECEMHVCEYCHMVFSQIDKLNVHLDQQHSEMKAYQCRLCTICKRYKSKGFLLQHYLKIHSQSTIGYYCGDCKQSSQHQSMIDVEKHFQEYHFRNEIPAINKQSMETNWPDHHYQYDDSDTDLEMHEEFLDEFLLSSEDNIKLEECFHELGDNLPDIFTISSNEAGNEIADLKQQYAFACPHCSDQQFRYPSKLIEHISQQHNYPLPANGESMSLPCPYCSKTYNNIIKLRQHLRIVHTLCKRHICQLCDNQFATIDHLRKHVLGQHQNERNYTCDTCQKSFKQISHLRQHQSIHTLGKTHNCHLCVKKFWRKIDLLRHLNRNHHNSDQI